MPLNLASKPTTAPDFLTGGGEMGALMRAHDWSASPLGDPGDWPQSLRSVVGLMLANRHLMFVAWGPELAFLYNDGYAPVFGAKHPWALGRPFREVWPEIWDDIEPLVDKALAGEATWSENLHLVMHRNGYPEDCWFTFSYSPVRDESGRVAGMFCAGTETTSQVLAERRERAERERLAQMFEQAPGFIAMLEGPEHRFTLANAAYRKLIGGRDVLGKPVREALPEIGDQGFFELFDRVYATGVPHRGSSTAVRVARGEGQPTDEHFLDFIYQPILVDGQVTGIFVEGYDVTDAHASSAALRESEAQLARERTLLSTLVEHLPVGLIAVDRDGRPLLHNPAYRRIVPEAVIPSHLPDAADRWIAYDEQGGRIPPAQYPGARALRGELVRRAEFINRAPDGREIWTEISGIPLRDATGAITGALCVIVEIDAHKRVEQDLRQLTETLEERVAQALAERQVLADVVESTTAAVMVCDLDLRILAFNRAEAEVFEAAHGRPLKVGDNLLELVADRPAELDRLRSNWTRVLAGDEFIVVDEVGDPARHATTFEMRYNVLRDRDGKQIGAFQTAFDVTDRVRAAAQVAEAEAARREADARYRAYFENTPEALFVIGVTADGDFVIEETNPAHQAGVGMRTDELRGKRIDEILPPAVARRVLDNYRQVLATGAIHQYREQFDLDGEAEHWDTTLLPVTDAEGRIVRLIGSSRNVTRQVMAEEALRQSQKMEAMGQLTGGVSHDFNNLLSPIIGSLDLLQRRGVGDERERRLIDGALASAEKAKTLVQRLLAFARRQPLQPAAVDIVRLVTGMADLVDSTIGPRVQVRIDVADGLPPARADANQIEMALLNLAVNARDAMPDGGTLTIAAHADTIGAGHRSRLAPGHYVRLSVTDTGTGMDEATLTRAIEPFFSTKGIGKGTGLGLSMVHGLAAQLGGALAISSKPGLGTNVELWLPVAQTPADAADRPSAAATPTRASAGTVLLVDDEELVRMSTADMLAELGYDVVEASSAEEALRLVDGGLAPDLLVTDHLMPGMTGTELARELRERGPRIPTLVISGYAEVDGIAPDLPRLTKPFRQADLAASVAELTKED